MVSRSSCCNTLQRRLQVLFASRFLDWLSTLLLIFRIDLGKNLLTRCYANSDTRSKPKFRLDPFFKASSYRSDHSYCAFHRDRWKRTRVYWLLHTAITVFLYLVRNHRISSLLRSGNEVEWYGFYSDLCAPVSFLVGSVRSFWRVAFASRSLFLRDRRVRFSWFAV